MTELTQYKLVTHTTERFFDNAVNKLSKEDWIADPEALKVTVTDTGRLVYSILLYKTRQIPNTLFKKSPHKK